MCHGCWIEAGAPTYGGEDAARLAVEARDFYSYGALHIVIGDWNVEDHHFDTCLKDDRITEPEAKWAREMLDLTEGQRIAVLALADEFFEPRKAY